MTVSTATTGPTERDFWDRTVGWWHVAFVGVVLLAAVRVAIDDEVSVRRRLVAVALAGACCSRTPSRAGTAWGASASTPCRWATSPSHGPPSSS
jgi:hypothetical protein